jgi:hypothetical protein
MANGRAHRGDRLVAGASWAEARTVGGTTRVPCGFARAFAHRLARAGGHDGHAQRPGVRGRVGWRHPHPSHRRGPRSEAQGLCQPQTPAGCEGLHPVDPGRPLASGVLRDASDRQALGRPGRPQQALEPAHGADSATTGGVGQARLPLAHVALETAPGKRVPSLPRSPDRGPSVWTAPRTFPLPVAGPPSASPLAFPGAFAAETIPLPLAGG